MIEAKDAISTARSYIGTSYSEMDCIRLIVMVIRSSPGGMKSYRCEGTNWLWRSIDNSGKYRHLIWRKDGTDDAQAGMLAFKRRGEDVHHVGLVTGEGTVIHASSAAGYVTETELDGSWTLLGAHRYIRHEARSGEEAKAAQMTKEQITIIDSAGRRFMPEGDWRVIRGSMD